MKCFLLSALLVLGACTQSESPGDSAGEPLRDETLHALMAQRIDYLYRRIETLAFDQNRTLPELDEDRQRTANEIADTAGTLSGVAIELTQLTPALNLSASGQQRFQNLSRSLRDASNEVARTALALSPDLAISITSLQETCSACHSLYRGR